MEDLSLCRKLMEILLAFGKEPTIEQEDWRKIVKDLGDQVIGALAPRQLTESCAIGVVRDLFKMNPFAVWSHLPRKALRRLMASDNTIRS
jgi:hypothetical protein